MRFVLQSDWADAFASDEKAWVSLYAPGLPTIHGFVDKNGYSAEFAATIISKKEIRIENADFSTTFRTWDCEYRTDSFSHHFLDVSPNQSLLVKNTFSGLSILDCETREERRSVSFSVPPCLCRFFPSGKVLAVAEHNTLHICDIGTGTIPRTFKGHSSSINDILFLGSGRNFVTCSSDGTCRLWETSTGEEVDQLVTQGHGSLTCISLIKTAQQSSNPNTQLYFTDGDEGTCSQELKRAQATCPWSFSTSIHIENDGS